MGRLNEHVLRAKEHYDKDKDMIGLVKRLGAYMILVYAMSETHTYSIC